jgi:hypothetical protein
MVLLCCCYYCIYCFFFPFFTRIIMFVVDFVFNVMLLFAANPSILLPHF